MKKPCDHYMEQYLALDKGQRVPLSLTWHLLGCPSCRNEIRLLSHAERIAARPLKIAAPLTSESITTAVRELDPDYVPPAKNVRILDWIVIGLIVVLAFLVLSLLVAGNGNQLLMIFSYLAFAGSVTLYCVLFVGTNLDFFVKKFHSPLLHA